jgi:hypothetical protein
MTRSWYTGTQSGGHIHAATLEDGDPTQCHHVLAGSSLGLVPVGTSHAAARKPAPTPTPSPTATPSGSDGVNAQATGLLNPGLTFCLPIQQVAGANGGQVAGGGFTFDNARGSPHGIPWTSYNGPSAESLSVIAQQTTSYFHQIITVPIGSFFRTYIQNSTRVVVSFQMQQSETVLN